MSDPLDPRAANGGSADPNKRAAIRAEKPSRSPGRPDHGKTADEEKAAYAPPGGQTAGILGT